jgi:hypothetical protein
MRDWSQRLIGLAALAGVTATSIAAYGWKMEGKINASIHDHAFYKVKMEQPGDGCVVNFKLTFYAPSNGYQDPAKGRNYYRFKARVELSEGKTVFSPQFANDAPGRRSYRWSTDTTEEGCWAEKPHKLYNVDVEGCRNRNCRVKPFE